MNQREMIHALLHGKVWTFVEDPESKGLIALDQSGLIMDEDVLTSLMNGVAKFLEFYGNDNIVSANMAREEETLQAREVALRSIPREKQAYTGTVYFLKGENGLTKIGMSARSATDRIGKFEPKLPFDTELFHVIDCKSPRSVEASFHQHFKEKRVRGEWFNLSDADLAMIKEISMSEAA